MFDILFQSIGLSEIDARVYEALLNLKSATPAKVAQHARISRENAYYILKKLAGKRLVKQDPTAAQIRFDIVHPESIYEHIKERNESLERAKAELTELIEYVQRTVETIEGQVTMRHYTDVAGVKQAYQDFIRGYQDDTMLSVINYNWRAGLDGYFMTERMKINMHLRMIVADNARGRMLASKDTVENRVTKLIPQNAFPEASCIYCLRDRFMFIHRPLKGGDDIAIFIEQPLLAHAFRALFELIWGSVV